MFPQITRLHDKVLTDESEKIIILILCFQRFSFTFIWINVDCYMESNDNNGDIKKTIAWVPVIMYIMWKKKVITLYNY